MLWLQEAHGEEYQFGLDDLRLTLLNHNGASTFWVWLPVYLLNFYSCKFAVLTQELEGVDVPTTRAFACKAEKLDSIRYEIDKLELIVDDALWPLPKYRELLFIR